MTGPLTAGTAPGPAGDLPGPDRLGCRCRTGDQVVRTGSARGRGQAAPGPGVHPPRPDLFFPEFGNIVWKKARLLQVPEITEDEGRLILDPFGRTPERFERIAI